MTTRRHYAFLLEGLKDVEEALEERGIKFVVGRGSPDEVALLFGEKASMIVCDGGSTCGPRRSGKSAAEGASRRVVRVESNAVVPVEVKSNKREHAARTLRPKIRRHLEEFLVELEPTKVEQPSLDMEVEGGLDLSDIDALLDGMDLDRGAWPLRHLYTGGTTAAKEKLEEFIENRLDRYVANRNQPQTSFVSHMSKYLHFMHISPVFVALRIREANFTRDGIDSFLEEMIARRELSINFVYYTPDYDEYFCIPEWARKTLEEHKNDEREHLYTRKQI